LSDNSQLNVRGVSDIFNNESPSTNGRAIQNKTFTIAEMDMRYNYYDLSPIFGSLTLEDNGKLTIPRSQDSTYTKRLN
jgi:hypothetical protein